jgi:hypothetical protein
MDKIKCLFRIVLLFCCTLNIAFSQTPKKGFSQQQKDAACACEDVSGNMLDIPNAIVDEKEIDYWVNMVFLPMFNELIKQKSSIKTPIHRVNLIPVEFCVWKYGALAKKCEKQASLFNNNPYMILYDESFIKKIDNDESINVLFVLGHELGHILSEHYHDDLFVDPNYRKFAKNEHIDYEPEIIEKNKLKGKNQSLKERHIEELTADAYAIWFLKMYYEKNRGNTEKSKRFSNEKLQNIFPQIEHIVADKCRETESHPSCKRRGYYLTKLLDYKNWNNLKNFRQTPKGFAEEYHDSTYVNTEADNPIAIRFKGKLESDSLKRVGIELLKNESFLEAKEKLLTARKIYSRLVFPEDSIEVSKKLSEINEILSVKSFCHFSLIGGSNYLTPKLQTDGVPINATNAVLGQVGIRLGRYNYENPLGFEIDALYDLEAWQFDTYNTDKKAIERFNMSKVITIQPKLTFKFLNFNRSNKSKGLVFSVGASWMNPLKFTYLNFQIIEQNIGLTMKPSWGITTGLGFEQIQRKLSGKFWGLLRISFVGTYQPLRFESPQLIQQNYSANAWQFGLMASVGVLPKFLTKRKY